MNVDFLYTVKYDTYCKPEYRLYDGNPEPTKVIAFAGKGSNVYYWLDYNDYTYFINDNNLPSDTTKDLFRLVTDIINNTTTKSYNDLYRYDGNIRVKVADWANYLFNRYKIVVV